MKSVFDHGRNAECICGSKLKYKKCCLVKERAEAEKRYYEDLMSYMKSEPFVVKGANRMHTAKLLNMAVMSKEQENYFEQMRKEKDPE